MSHVSRIIRALLMATACCMIGVAIGLSYKPTNPSHAMQQNETATLAVKKLNKFKPSRQP